MEVASPTLQSLPRDVENVGKKANRYGFPITPDQTIPNECVGGQGTNPHTDLEDQFYDTECSVRLNGGASNGFHLNWLQNH